MAGPDGCVDGGTPGYEHVFIFENNGEVVGVSNPHPHCQIYATPFVFHTVAQEVQAVERYREAEAENLFDAIIRSERARRASGFS